MNIQDIINASIEELTDELAAAGCESTTTDIHYAREAVARLIDETYGPFDLLDSITQEFVGEATADQAAESATAPCGIILVDGRAVYVAE